jgi:hypothetical protein
VILTRSTPLFDLVNGTIIKSDGEKPLEVPQARSLFKVRGKLQAASAGKTACQSTRRLSLNIEMSEPTRQQNWKII